MDQALFEQAKRRVENSRTLEPFASIILADWPEGDHHWRWVTIAPALEIAEWALSVDTGEGRQSRPSNVYGMD